MILRLLLALLMCGPNVIASAEPGAPQSEMLQAARAFLGTLNPAEKSQAMFPFNSEERFRWFYTPVPRKGISLKEMTETQKKAALNSAARRTEREGIQQSGDHPQAGRRAARTRARSRAHARSGTVLLHLLRRAEREQRLGLAL